MSDRSTRPETTDELIARLQSEGLITMRQATKLYARATHKATVVRHCTKGVEVRGKRIKLEAILIGGRLATSEAAVRRFFAAMNDEPQPLPVALSRTPTQRRRAAARAAAELDAMGVK